MNVKIRSIIVGLTIFGVLAVSFGLFRLNNFSLIQKHSNQDKDTINTVIVDKVDSININDELLDYLNALSLLEANGDPTARRSGSQYIGNYQIGNSARGAIGLNKLNNEEGYQVMLNDTFLQDMIMLRLLQANVIEMKEYFKKYDRTKVGGWYVTTSGILAMTHLLGGQNTKSFLDSDGKTIARDGNNRPITDYLQLNNFNILVDSIATGGYIKQILSKINIK